MTLLKKQDIKSFLRDLGATCSETRQGYDDVLRGAWFSNGATVYADFTLRGQEAVEDEPLIGSTYKGKANATEAETIKREAMERFKLQTSTASLAGIKRGRRTAIATRLGQPAAAIERSEIVPVTPRWSVVNITSAIESFGEQYDHTDSLLALDGRIFDFPRA